MRGDTQLLKKLVEDHVTGVKGFASLRSRYENHLVLKSKLETDKYGTKSVQNSKGV